MGHLDVLRCLRECVSSPVNDGGEDDDGARPSRRQRLAQAVYSRAIPTLKEQKQQKKMNNKTQQRTMMKIITKMTLLMAGAQEQ